MTLATPTTRAPPPLARTHAQIARIARNANANTNTKHDFPAAGSLKLFPPLASDIYIYIYIMYMYMYIYIYIYIY